MATNEHDTTQEAAERDAEQQLASGRPWVSVTRPL